MPLPHELPLADYERLLYKFLFKRSYAASPLSWAQDKEIRDAGPFIGGLNYGTHPAVRIYYSPEVIDWLRRGRQGAVADGGMIVKEMFPPPAALYVDPVVGTPPAKDPATGASPLDGLISAWTVMVKDSSAAKGGWFYANPAAPKIDTSGKTPAEIEKAIEAAVEQALDHYNFPFDFPASGVALGTCQRCHASAANELTFSSLSNVLGFPGIRSGSGTTAPGGVLNTCHSCRRGSSTSSRPPPRPRSPGRVAAYLGPRPRPPAPARTDRADNHELQRFIALGLHGPQARRAIRTAAPAMGMVVAPTPPPAPDPAFVAMFPMSSPTTDPKKFPGQWADRVVAGPNGPESYVTSDNCLGCHGGLAGAPFGLTMFVQTDPAYGHGYNVSEYGEWRWSPMGLAGRDPIFHAQVESELALLDSEFPPAKAAPAKAALLNLCLSCHGAMGQRQLVQDARAGHTSPATGRPLDPNFKLEYFYLTTALDAKGLKQKDYEYHKYGNLAREGVSCTICHHIDKADPAEGEGVGLQRHGILPDAEHDGTLRAGAG